MFNFQFRVHEIVHSKSELDIGFQRSPSKEIQLQFHREIHNLPEINKTESQQAPYKTKVSPFLRSAFHSSLLGQKWILIKFRAVSFCDGIVKCFKQAQTYFHTSEIFCSKDNFLRLVGTLFLFLWSFECENELKFILFWD